MKRVYILSGLPGMGKSTLANVLLLGHVGLGHIVSADHYLVNEDGKYEWSVERLKNAHALCRRRYFSLIAEELEVVGDRIVILDNTNLAKREFAEYKRAAEDHGWQVFEICVGNLDVDTAEKRNTHQVPRATLEKMRDRLRSRWATG